MLFLQLANPTPPKRIIPDIRSSGSFGYPGRTKIARRNLRPQHMLVRCMRRGRQIQIKKKAYVGTPSHGVAAPSRAGRISNGLCLSGSVLQQAAETYGAAVAEFAERAEASGRRGTPGAGTSRTKHFSTPNRSLDRATPDSEHLARARTFALLW